MNLTEQQSKYIKEHLRDKEKTYAICATAKRFAEITSDIGFLPEEIEKAALVMNIGETSEKMSVDGINIYSKEYGPWDEKAKALNSSKGEESIKMATEQGIELSEDAKQAIICTSKGGSLNNMGIVLKLAQTMEAIKYPRWSRGEKKEPAKDLKEVTQILDEELDFMLKDQNIDEQAKADIKTQMLSVARRVYVKQRQASIRYELLEFDFDEAKTMQEMGVDYLPLLESEEERLNRLFSNVPEDKIDELYYEIKNITESKESISKYEIERNVRKSLKAWDEKYNIKDANNKALD